MSYKILKPAGDLGEPIMIMTEANLIGLIQRTILPDATKLDEFNVADFYSQRRDLYGEIKCLRKHHSTILLEKAKYDELLPLPNARYIVSTPNGVWSWRVRDLRNIVWQELYLSNISTYYHRETEGGYKTVTFIPIASAMCISNLIGWEIGM